MGWAGWVVVAVWTYLGVIVGGHMLQRALEGHPVRSWQFRVRHVVLGALIVLTYWMVPVLRRRDPEGWADVDEKKFQADLHEAHAREMREHVRALRKRNRKLRKRVAR